MDCRVKPGNDDRLMIVARDADGARDIAIAGRKFETRAGGLLADGVAIKFLPRCLVFRIGKTALGHEIGVAFLEFVRRDQNVGFALFEIDADLVASLKYRTPAVRGRFRRSVENRRGARRAGLASVADAGQRGNAFLMSAAGGCMFTTSAPPG